MPILVALVMFVVVIVVAHSVRRHLTDALLSPLIGAFLGGSLIWLVWAIVSIVPWQTLRAVLAGVFLLAVTLSATALPLWLLAYLPLRRASPTLDARHPIDHAVVDPWLAAGFTDPAAMRLRSGGSRVMYTLADPKGFARLYLISLESNWVPFVVSRVQGGTLTTTDSSLLMVDSLEIRQLVSSKDPATMLKLHANGIDYLAQAGAQAADIPSAEDLVGDCFERYRRIIRRRPWRVVTSLFRAPLHLGALGSRPSRRWQARVFASQD